MGCPIAWDRVRTVLLDMDGTLLDLAFDNFFWRELIPAQFARREGISPERARAHIHGLYEAREGSLDWYCLDHWERALGLDLVTLKRQHLDGVRFLPGVPGFLDALARAGFHRVIATNAHGTTLSLKLEHTGLKALVDEVHSSHQLGAAKEEQGFWAALQGRLALDPVSTVLIDDNLAVLDAAERFGIGQCLAITQPDSTRPPDGAPARHRGVVGVAALTPGLMARAREGAGRT